MIFLDGTRLHIHKSRDCAAREGLLFPAAVAPPRLAPDAVDPPELLLLHWVARLHVALKAQQ